MIVKDSIIWAIVALGLGLGAALAVRRLQGVDRPANVWRREAARIEKDFLDAWRHFRRGSSGDPWHGFDSKEDFATRLAKLRETIAAVKGRSFDSVSGEDRGQVIDELDALRTHSDAVHSLQATAKALDEALDEVESRAPIEALLDDAADSAPSFATKARKLLEGKQMKVAALQTRIEDIKKATAPIQGFPELHAIATRGGQRAAALDEVPEDFEEPVRKARQEATAAWTRIWEAPDAKAAFDPDLHEQLAAALGALAGWRALVDDQRRYGAAAQPATLRFSAIDLGRGETARFAGELGTLRLRTAAATQALSPEEQIRHYSKAIASGDRWLVLAAWSAALYAGLFALYFDKTWGTPTDYLIAFLWGFTTTATIDALAGMLRQRANPDALLKPEAEAAKA